MRNSVPDPYPYSKPAFPCVDQECVTGAVGSLRTVFQSQILQEAQRLLSRGCWADRSQDFSLGLLLAQHGAEDSQTLEELGSRPACRTHGFWCPHLDVATSSRAGENSRENKMRIIVQQVCVCRRRPGPSPLSRSPCCPATTAGAFVLVAALAWVQRPTEGTSPAAFLRECSLLRKERRGMHAGLLTGTMHRIYRRE